MLSSTRAVTVAHSGAGVFGDVGQRFGDDEVGGRLERGGEPADRHVGLHGHGHPRRKRGHSRAQPTAGEGGGEDAVGELAQLHRRLLGVVERLGHQAGEVVLLVRQGLLGELERDDRVDQPLLRAVVQIANHAPALVVGRRHDPRPRGGHLRPRLGVRDRGRDEFREVLEARFGARGQRLGSGRVDRQRTPEPLPDKDRAADRGADAQASDGGGDRAGNGVPVVDPGGSPCLRDQRRGIAPLGREAIGEGRVLARGGPGGHGRHVAIGLVAEHPREVGAEQPADLFGDRREDLAFGHSARDERRHAPKGRLLVGQPPDLRPRLGVRDRRRHELRERGEPRLGVGRQRLLRRGQRDQAPDAALDDDRRPDGRAERLLAHGRAEPSGGIAIVVDPG